MALVASAVAAAGGDPPALLLLGIVGALSVLFLVLVVVARVVSGRGVVRAFPVGAAVGIAVDEDGIGFTGSTSSAHLRWPAISGITRVGGELRLGGADRALAFFFPGRLLDDADLATIAARIATGRARTVKGAGVRRGPRRVP